MRPRCWPTAWTLSRTGPRAEFFIDELNEVLRHTVQRVSSGAAYQATAAAVSRERLAGGLLTLGRLTASNLQQYREAFSEPALWMKRRPRRMECL